MTTRRRWLQFSLRTAFVVFAVLAAWLGIIVARAKKQREAVEAIEALGGTLVYDWHTEFRVSYDKKDAQWHLESKSRPNGPAWLQELTQKVYEVHFLIPSPETDGQVRKSIPHLQRLGPYFVALEAGVSNEVYEELKAALPRCQVSDRHRRK